MKNLIIGFCIECISLYQYIREGIQRKNNVRNVRRSKHS